MISVTGSVQQASNIQTIDNPLISTAMDHGFIVIMFFLTFFGSIFGIVYFYFATRNRERLALIEKNADASLFKIEHEPANVFRKFSIKLGMLFVGGGLGILAGNILEMTTSLERPVAYLSMIFVWAGAGLISSYFVARRIKN
jgi:hypothetical protein